MPAGAATALPREQRGPREPGAWRGHPTHAPTHPYSYRHRLTPHPNHWSSSARLPTLEQGTLSFDGFRGIDRQPCL